MRHCWYKDHFVVHPAVASRNATAFTGTGVTRDKVKVWCRKCLGKLVDEVMAEEVVAWRRTGEDKRRGEHDIMQELLNREGGDWIPRQTSRCLVHLRNCELQSPEVRERARQQQARCNAKRRRQGGAVEEPSPAPFQLETQPLPPSAGVALPGNVQAIPIQCTAEILSTAVPSTPSVNPGLLLRSQEDLGRTLQLLQEHSIPALAVNIPVLRDTWPSSPSTMLSPLSPDILAELDTMSTEQYLSADYSPSGELSPTSSWQSHSPLDARPNFALSGNPHFFHGDPGNVMDGLRLELPTPPTQYNIPAQSFASHELASSHMPPHSFHSGQWQMPARAGPSCQPSSWNNGLR